MTLEALTSTLKNWLDSMLHSDWLSTLITAVLILLVTAACAHAVTLFLRKVLRSNKGPLPSVSIFINIGRVSVWIIGVCVVLSSCFNVNVGAAVTALGIGGIAVSLGFQSTLSNLISGLQITMSKLIEPGDRIKVGGYEGVVSDITWWNTRLLADGGEKVIVPNSVLNTSALVKFPSAGAEGVAADAGEGAAASAGDGAGKAAVAKRSAGSGSFAKEAAHGA